MEIYFFNAVSLLLSALIVTFIAVVYQRKRKTKGILVFIISLLGSSLGLLMTSWFDIHEFGREVLFFSQFALALCMATVLVTVFFYLQLKE